MFVRPLCLVEMTWTICARCGRSLSRKTRRFLFVRQAQRGLSFFFVVGNNFLFFFTGRYYRCRPVTWLQDWPDLTLDLSPVDRKEAKQKRPGGRYQFRIPRISMGWHRSLPPESVMIEMFSDCSQVTCVTHTDQLLQLNDMAELVHF